MFSANANACAMLSLLLCILLVLQPFALAKKKPKDFFSQCKLSDPNLSKCILHAAVEATPLILNGIPELKFLPLDPLIIPKLEINQGQGNFKLNLVLTNMTIRGAGNIIFNEKDYRVKKDFTMVNFSANSNSSIIVESDYSIDGQVLVLPVKGSGKNSFIFDDVLIKGSIEFDSYSKKGEKYIRCKHVDVSFEPEKVKVHFSNLFNGDKQLGDSANKFFNENWKETYDTLKELPQKGFGQVFQQYITQGFSSYPMKDWFLPE